MDAPGEVRMLAPNEVAALRRKAEESSAYLKARFALDDNWMRVAPGTDAAIWRPWSRETGEL